MFTLDHVATTAALACLDQPPYYVIYSGHELGRRAAELMVRRLKDGAWLQQAIAVPVQGAIL